MSKTVFIVTSNRQPFSLRCPGSLPLGEGAREEPDVTRTRTALAAAVLATGLLAVPAALADEPVCDKPVGLALHEAHEAAEAVVGEDLADAVHDAEEQYCASPLPV
jgi:hypothetical protein